MFYKSYILSGIFKIECINPIWGCDDCDDCHDMNKIFKLNSDDCVLSSFKGIYCEGVMKITKVKTIKDRLDKGDKK